MLLWITIVVGFWLVLRSLSKDRREAERAKRYAMSRLRALPEPQPRPYRAYRGPSLPEPPPTPTADQLRDEARRYEAKCVADFWSYAPKEYVK